MLPDFEHRLLQCTIQRAKSKATLGQPDTGRWELKTGLGHALEALREGEPWAGELVRSYYQELRSFCLTNSLTR